jgi:hypothetical protein
LKRFPAGWYFPVIILNFLNKLYFFFKNLVIICSRLVPDRWQRFARLAGFCFILITGKGSPGWQDAVSS